MNSARRLFTLLTLGLVALSAAGATELRPFTAKSLEAIRAAHRGQPFILAFWALHCAPCKEEMVVLKALKEKHPSLPIVLVSTDSPEARPAVVKFLASRSLEGIELWAFADEFAERVRFAVDRSWRGELPRTYFFDAAHQTTARTGAVDPAWVETWLAGARRGQGK